MDIFKDSILKLGSLSESDKDRLIVQLLFNNDSNKQNDPEIQRLLSEKSPEKNSPSPKKKQKTLDGWLIKRNDSKESTDRTSSQQAAKSDVDKVLESEKNFEETNTGDLTQENLGHFIDDSIFPSTSRLVEKSSLNSELFLSVSKKGETNSLCNKKCSTRSKRKVSLPSPGSECERTPKRVKSTCDKPDNINPDEQIRREEPTDPNCTFESNNTSHKNISRNDNCISKNKKYNLRTKTKNLKLVQVEEASNRPTSENSQTDTVTSNANHSSKNTESKLKSEAFSKMSQICKEMNIDISEILKNKNVETVLHDPKILSKDAIVLIGALKLDTGKTSPVVHLAKSKKKLLELLVSKQKKLST